MRRTDTTHKRQVGPLRRIVSTDESGFHVVFTLECGHSSLMYPYKFKEHKPYPARRRCFASCVWEPDA
jgi:hypothetical protein